MRSLTLAYERGDFRRSVTIAASPPAAVTRHGFAFTLELAPASSGRPPSRFPRTPRSPGSAFARREPRGGLEESTSRSRPSSRRGWPRAPVLQAEDPALAARTARASAISARFACAPTSPSGATLPAAGLPWFMALFGRDSLITSFQALPYLPGLAATTLRVLAARQAQVRDDFHEQEPGKILHELRFGELTARRRATPLTVFRHRRRDAAVPGPARRVPPLVRRRRARAGARAQRPCGPGLDRRTAATATAMDTSSTNAATRHRPGQPVLEGQLELDPVRRRHARAGPIATCEIQGYVYDAQRRSARLAREVWDDEALADAARAARRRPPRALPPRLLDARARLPRARPRRRQTPSRQPDLQHRPPAVVGHPRRRARQPPPPSGCSTSSSTPAGASAPSARARPATTRSATTPGRSGRTTTR